MDDLVRLLNSYLADQTLAEDVLAVATVVNTRGSAYRRPGARMIIRSSGEVDGAVSAGCLERDIVAHCQEIDSLKKPLLLTYDGSSRDDLIFGLKLGCDGIVQVLLEAAGRGSLYRARASALADLLPELFSKGKTVAGLNIFQAVDTNTAEPTASNFESNLASNLGLALLGTTDETFAIQPDCPLPQAVIERATEQIQMVLSAPRPQSIIWQENIKGFEIAALIEIIEPLTSLLLFGSGQDLDATARFARMLGWQVEIIDDRKLESVALARLHAGAAVIITHDYNRDKKILAALFGGDISYIGVVGPRLRAEKLLAELALDGIPITNLQTDRLYSPAGLDIGAERPEEIALSIVAEIKAVFTNHSGGRLRFKEGGIHQPEVHQPEVYQADSRSVGQDLPPSASSLITGLPLKPTCNL